MSCFKINSEKIDVFIELLERMNSEGGRYALVKACLFSYLAHAIF